jgi:hypothetical protein
MSNLADRAALGKRDTANAVRFAELAEAAARLWQLADPPELAYHVDRLQAWAVHNGLVDDIGQDAVQWIMHCAFYPLREDLQIATERAQALLAELAARPATKCSICSQDPCATPGFCNESRRLDALPKPEPPPEPKPQVPASLLQAAEYLFRLGDKPRMKTFLEGLSETERKGIYEHLKQKVRR